MSRMEVCILLFSNRSLLIDHSTKVTPRRWLDQCNPALSALISKTLKLEKVAWLKDLTKLEGLLPFAEEKTFRNQWAAVKQMNKERLAHYVKATLGYSVNTKALFNVQIKVSLSYKQGRIFRLN